MSNNPSEKFLNEIFGSKNVFINHSDSKFQNIHIGDQNTFYDNRHKILKTKCPKCGENASEEILEENKIYRSFKCENCGNIYYEYDEIARNVSNYLDLSGEQSINFERLISAVNHDLQVGFFQKAFERCLTHKETYGNTPQIYEWGALTLFLNTNSDFLIKSSCRQVILYLEKAREIDFKKNSTTYENISSSIATRYYGMIYPRIEELRNNYLSVSYNSQITKNEISIKKNGIRKQIYYLILELMTCYKISNDTDFVILGLQEMYGYKDIPWFKSKLISIFIKPNKFPEGYRRGLKGYVWDYHKIVPNSDELFEQNITSPSNLATSFEKILHKNGLLKELSEIRVGNRQKFPVSGKAKLIMIASGFHSVFILSSYILYSFKLFFPLCVALTLYFIILYSNNKSNSKNIDKFRRIINSKKEIDLKLFLIELKQNLRLNGIYTEIKRFLKEKIKW